MNITNTYNNKTASTEAMFVTHLFYSGVKIRKCSFLNRKVINYLAMPAV